MFGLFSCLKCVLCFVYGNLFELMIVLFRFVLWLFRYFVSECMMMLVLCLKGCVRYGVGIVLLMMSGMLWWCVILVSVVMLVMLFSGLLMVLVKMVFVWLLINVLNDVGLFGLVNCVVMFDSGSVCVNRL